MTNFVPLHGVSEPPAHLGVDCDPKMRRNMLVAVKPMQSAVKQNILEIPVKGPKSTGLRAAMARATKITIRASGSTAIVRLWVNPASMPASQRNLPSLMEGDGKKWRHPVYGNTAVWRDQASHPYFARAVYPRLAGVRAAVIAAVDQTVIEVESGKL